MGSTPHCRYQRTIRAQHAWHVKHGTHNTSRIIQLRASRRSPLSCPEPKASSADGPLLSFRPARDIQLSNALSDTEVSFVKDYLQLEVVSDKVLLFASQVLQLALVIGDLLPHHTRRVTTKSLPFPRQLPSLLTVVVKEATEVAQFLVVFRKPSVQFLHAPHLVLLLRHFLAELTCDVAVLSSKSFEVTFSRGQSFPHLSLLSSALRCVLLCLGVSTSVLHRRMGSRWRLLSRR